MPPRVRVTVPSTTACASSTFCNFGWITFHSSSLNGTSICARTYSAEFVLYPRVYPPAPPAPPPKPPPPPGPPRPPPPPPHPPPPPPPPPPPTPPPPPP